MSERYADKIAKLLRKAEDPNLGQAEAEAFIAKAQELMTTYAIDEAMIARARGDKQTEKIVTARIEYHSVYSRAQFEIGNALARANDVRPLVTRGKDLMRTTLHLIGFESDVNRVLMLNSSVQIQALGGLTRWYATQDCAGYSTRERFKVRRQYLFSFARGLHTQLQAAKHRGEEEAARMAGERGELNAGESVALMVRDKKDKVDGWIDENFGTLRRSSARFAAGSYEARQAGFAAGKRAHASAQSEVGGTRGVLTS